jgi:hypothetical protein
MGELNRVVAHYLTHKIVKGTTTDFFPNRPLFHLVPSSGPTLEIRCKDLKALFFVRDLNGNHRRRDVRGFLNAPSDNMHGKKIAVRFKDGELLCGYTLTFTPDREGFFVFPADPGSNNQRIYVITSSTSEIKAGPAADAMVQKLMGDEAA